MNRIRQRARTISREDGFTLPELLLAAALLIGLMGVMAAMITVVARTQPRIAERSGQIQSGRVMIEQLTRELREGSQLSGTQTASTLSFLTFVRRQVCGGTALPTSAATPAIECRVSYTCTAGACTRVEALPSGNQPGPPVRIVEGLNSSEVFGYSAPTNPGHVTVNLEFPAQEGDEAVTLSDGAALRN